MRDRWRSGRRRDRRRWARLALLVAALTMVIIGVVGSVPAGAVTAPTSTPAPSPSPSGAPTPAPAPPAPAVPGSEPEPQVPQTPTSTEPGPSPKPGSGGGGFLDRLFGWLPGAGDVAGLVGDAVNRWLVGVAQDAAQPVLHLMGQTVLSTPDVTGQDRIRELWGASLVIADSLFLLVLTVGGVAVMGEDLVHGRAMAREFAPRMAIGFGVAHLSLLAMSQGTTLANALTRAIVGQQVTADGVTTMLTTNLAVGAFVPIYLVLLEFGVLALAVALIVGWIIRMIVMMGLAVGGPLMLIWHGLPWTEGLAALWWRMFGGCLAIQIGQSMLLLLGTRVLLSADGRPTWLPSTDGLLNTLVAVALFYVAVRLQGWVLQLVLRSTGGGRSAVLTMVQYRTIRRAMAAVA
ncbi:hypothetical protein BCD49_39305 [Pseudofrankia sp. EUN1h]|nr:hypothetical protein BCD49_39305 [Pseudofrankia sp. EUN1h]